MSLSIDVLRIGSDFLTRRKNHWNSRKLQGISMVLEKMLLGATFSVCTTPLEINHPDFSNYFPDSRGEEYMV